MIIIPILTLALLLVLLVRFGRRRLADTPPLVPGTAEVDDGLYAQYGLPLQPGADGGLFGDAAPADTIKPGGGDFGGGGASSDWSTDSSDGDGGSDGASD